MSGDVYAPMCVAQGFGDGDDQKRAKPSMNARSSPEVLRNTVHPRGAETDLEGGHGGRLQSLNGRINRWQKNRKSRGASDTSPSGAGTYPASQVQPCRLRARFCRGSFADLLGDSTGLAPFTLRETHCRRATRFTDLFFGVVPDRQRFLGQSLLCL